MKEDELNKASVESLAADLAKLLRLPDSLLPVICEAIEKKAAADGITLARAQGAILERSLGWKMAYQMAPTSPIDEKWFKTARYNAWPRPSRYLQRLFPAARRPRRRR